MEILTAVFSGFALALVVPLLYRFTRKWTGWILALLPLTLVIYFVSQINQISKGEVIKVSYNWIPSLGISLSFFVDGLSMLFVLIIAGIGALVMIYGNGYLSGHRNQSRFYVYILIFMASMIGVVVSDNLITLFIFWELTSISSYLLIGFDHEHEKSRAAALQALLITGGGGLALLAGLILLGHTSGSWQLSQLLVQNGAVREHALYVPILLLILLGAFSKSAQVPFHFWLPAAMQAPTPVSAYLHSATMVKAGVYLLARLNPILGGTDEWYYLVTLAGALTMVIGGLLALPQTDLKLLLAYSTVSALGTMVMLLGFSTTLATKAAIVFLLVHALYKGSLFMMAGAVAHETGTRDVNSLSGLIKYMPITAAAAVLAAFSMSGFPPLLGFISKELLYEAKIQAPSAALIIIVVGVVANMINVTVAAIVGIRPFIGDKSVTPKQGHEAPVALWLGPLMLAGAGLIFGLFPTLIANSLISPAVSAVQAEITTIKLKLWHGINPVLMLSVFTAISGIGLFFKRHAIRRFAARLKFILPVTPTRLYENGLNSMLGLARVQTKLLQSGYLRNYILLVICTAMGLLGYKLLINNKLIPSLNFTGIRFYEIGIAVLILLATLMAVRTRSRLGAVAALGVIGFSIALIYVFYGAPDLAMTQLLVETLTVLLFVLILYRLPRYTKLSKTTNRVRDAFIALAAGGMMTTLVLLAVNVKYYPSISSFFAEKSLTQAHGRNIVNVILVDFRAMDTLGEITVLTVAALGVYALLKLKKLKK